jgi:hypothetical protein
MARAAAAPPLNDIVNIGGPQKISFEQLARNVLAEQNADKSIVVDPEATYFGARLHERSLVTPD